MGEVVGVGLIAHVPTIMLPREERLEINEGKEISLVPGLERLRKDVFESDDYDTVIVLPWRDADAAELAAELVEGADPTLQLFLPGLAEFWLEPRNKDTCRNETLHKHAALCRGDVRRTALSGRT